MPARDACPAYEIHGTRARPSLTWRGPRLQGGPRVSAQDGPARPAVLQGGLLPSKHRGTRAALHRPQVTPSRGRLRLRRMLGGAAALSRSVSRALTPCMLSDDGDCHGVRPSVRRGCGVTRLLKQVLLSMPRLLGPWIPQLRVAWGFRVAWIGACGQDSRITGPYTRPPPPLPLMRPRLHCLASLGASRRRRCLAARATRLRSEARKEAALRSRQAGFTGDGWIDRCLPAADGWVPAAD